MPGQGPGIRNRSTCKAILSKPDRGVQVIIHLVGLYLLLIEDLA
jgi:hypothetical protein